MGSHL